MKNYTNDNDVGVIDDNNVDACDDKDHNNDVADYDANIDIDDNDIDCRDNNAFFILVYSDFYEIPLPALRFEKVEETDTKKWKTTPKRNDAFQTWRS